VTSSVLATVLVPSGSTATAVATSPSNRGTLPAFRLNRPSRSGFPIREYGPLDSTIRRSSEDE
jgi:hypothetical protein